MIKTAHNAGMHVYSRLKTIEERAKEFGFRFCHSRYGNLRDIDTIALAPYDQQLPIYSRDAEIYAGPLGQIEAFLHGIEFAKRYYSQLNLIDDTKVLRKEQDYRNRKMLNDIKDSNVKEQQ